MPRKGKGPRATGRGRAGRSVTYNVVRKLALAMPGVEDSRSYGTPALKVRGRLLARLKEDGRTLVVIVDFGMREALMQAEPGTFFITDHYLNYPAILVRLATVRPARLREILRHGWRRVAPARVRSGQDDVRGGAG